MAASAFCASRKVNAHTRAMNHFFIHSPMPQCGALYSGDCRGRGISHRICEELRKVHHSRQPIRLGKYEAKNQTLSPIKIGQKISANRHVQGLTSTRRKAPISIRPKINNRQTQLFSSSAHTSTNCV